MEPSDEKGSSRLEWRTMPFGQLDEFVDRVRCPSRVEAERSLHHVGP